MAASLESQTSTSSRKFSSNNNHCVVVIRDQGKDPGLDEIWRGLRNLANAYLFRLQKVKAKRTRNRPPISNRPDPVVQRRSTPAPTITTPPLPQQVPVLTVPSVVPRPSPLEASQPSPQKWSKPPVIIAPSPASAPTLKKPLPGDPGIQKGDKEKSPAKKETSRQGVVAPPPKSDPPLQEKADPSPKTGVTPQIRRPPPGSVRVTRTTHLDGDREFRTATHGGCNGCSAYKPCNILLMDEYTEKTYEYLAGRPGLCEKCWRKCLYVHKHNAKNPEFKDPNTDKVKWNWSWL